MNGHAVNGHAMAQFKMPPRMNHHPTILRPAPAPKAIQANSMGIPNGSSTIEPQKTISQRPMPFTSVPIIKKPELKTPIVVHASSSQTQQQPSQPATQPHPQPSPTQPQPPTPVTLPPASTPAPVISTTPVSQSQVITQILSDQLRVELKTFETKIESKIESVIRDVVGAIIRDFKTQFETSQIVGDVLNDKLPVFARPDPTTTVEYTLAKGTKIKLFMPFTSNVHGYWATTSFVTSNGSVATGYVPIFSPKLDGVEYGLSTSELKSRRDQWKSHLDQLSDKEFIPNVGRFAES